MATHSGNKSRIRQNNQMSEVKNYPNAKEGRFNLTEVFLLYYEKAIYTCPPLMHTTHTPHTCAHMLTCHRHRHHVYTQHPGSHRAGLSPCKVGRFLFACSPHHPPCPLKTISILFEEINSTYQLLRIWNIWASFECVLLKFYFYNTRSSSVLWTLLTTQKIKRRSPFRQ